MEIKSQILDTARHLFMRYGIRSVTMDDLARELGISKKTLYQSIENKADLIDQVINQFLEAEEMSIAFIRSRSEDAIAEMLMISKHVMQMLRQLRPSTLYDLQKYYRPAWNKLEAHHKGHVYSVVRENIEWGKREGLYRPDVNADIIAKLYVSKSFVLVDESHFPLADYNREALLREFIHYHLHGIASFEGFRALEKYSLPDGGTEAATGGA